MKVGSVHKRKAAEGFLRCVAACPEERDAGEDAATSVGMTGGCWAKAGGAFFNPRLWSI